MGKVTIVVSVIAVLVASATHFGGILPILAVLVGLLAYAFLAPQHATMNADPAEASDARRRVAASTVSCDWVRSE